MPSEIRLSVIVASSGRASLDATLRSITAQTELLPAEILIDCNRDSPWGNAARQRQMERATGTHLLFMDDDDTYVAGAFEIVRREVGISPELVHMFRMRRPDGLDDVWRIPVVEDGNVSTQMVVVPNVPGKLARWGDRYQGDYDFIVGTCELQGQPVWHEHAIAVYGG